jgi:glutamate/tyrosine decarboxylase-like PLP-dependent enzyme
MTNGATTGNLIGLAAARQWAGQRLGFDPAVDGLFGQSRIPVIVSDATHASVIKALGTLGFGRGAVERIPAPSGRLDVAEFGARLAQFSQPVIVVATSGEVNTGQFDDLSAISEICSRHEPGAWLHVDAAFGLFAAASPRFADRLDGIEHADSVASDAHKWLNVPYDSGFVFVRDETSLRAAFSASGPYLSGSAGWDADDFSPEMSRRFRALPAWCALKAYGRIGYRHLVERCVDHAMSLASWVDSTEGFTLLNQDAFQQAPFNVVCFRLECEGLTRQELDALNRGAVTTIQKDGRVFITGTTWNGMTALRAAFVNWSTNESDIALLKRVLQETREQLITTSRGNS